MVKVYIYQQNSDSGSNSPITTRQHFGENGEKVALIYKNTGRHCGTNKARTNILRQGNNDITQISYSQTNKENVLAAHGIPTASDETTNRRGESVGI